jgi:hypothetical protein
MLAVACGTARTELPARRERAARTVETPSVRPGEALYSADDALRDALSGPWQYLGTGKWPGIRRMYACAFRNDRVLIVNVYCGPTDRQALRLDVYSPSRGRVRIYAEAKAPVSTRSRPDYFTFLAESEPPPSAEARMPPLSLEMSFQALRAYEDKRYGAFLPACFGGQELHRARGGCLGALAPRAPEWAARNRAFLDRANEDWYRVVRGMRSLATRYGKEPD